MGGDSNASTTNTTYTYTQNLNLQGVGAPTVVGDGMISIVETDQGAVQAAFSAIDRANVEQQKTLRESNQVLADAVQTAIREQRGAQRDALDAVQTAIREQRASQQDAFAFAARVNDAAYKWAKDASSSEAARITDTLSKWAIGAASVVALGMVLRGK